MKQSELIERVAKKGHMTKAESRRMVDIVMGELESGVGPAGCAGAARRARRCHGSRSLLPAKNWVWGTGKGVARDSGCGTRYCV